MPPDELKKSHSVCGNRDELFCVHRSRLRAARLADGDRRLCGMLVLRQALPHGCRAAGQEDLSKGLISVPAATSFRDPAGCCFALDHRILRLIENGSVPEVEAFLNSNSARKFSEHQQLIPTHRLAGADLARLAEKPVWRELAGQREIALVLEHERVAFPSFPCEWPPEMLSAAGALTLDLAEQSLAESFALKDATPYNVLFRGSRPVFVDLLSFERWRGAGVWQPYAPF